MDLEKEWLEKYQEKKEILKSPVDFNTYFQEKEIAGKQLDVISMGKVSLPSGKIIVRDPLVYLNKEAEPYFVTVEPGEYEVETCVVVPEDEGDCARYAAVKVSFTQEKPVEFIEALVGYENLDQITLGDYFGFHVDAGLGSICDVVVKEAYCIFEEMWDKENEGNIYDDYFAELFEKSYVENPKYQRSGGDWINWTIPGTTYEIPIFQSGFGDGTYPVYFGYDQEGKVCQLVIQFIDIHMAYEEDEDEEEVE